MALWGPVAYQVSLFPLPEKGAFVAMKETGTFVANRLGGTRWYPSESRAQDAWGPEGEPQRAFLGSALAAVGLQS